MKKTIVKSLTIVGIAGAVVLAPAPAMAYAPTPTPDSITAEIGTPFTVTFDPIFTPGETVEITLTGINGASQSLAAVGAVSSTSTSKTADDHGSVDATVTFNSDASGSYEVTATGATSGAADMVTVTVSGTSGAGDPGTDDAVDDGTDVSSTDEQLATTGADSLGLLVGGGALLIGGGAVLASRSVRKQKAQA
ncbi:hypothetical protein [Nesterenkonia muleiensis]|uniref:hypothetical protein n=1 Tax=Nesterenkonia muleiensis TaxID=2282648 RepID=UPI000E76EA15|nr:hypothetical protein [Nesterenkonia muleiensis]